MAAAQFLKHGKKVHRLLRVSLSDLRSPPQIVGIGRNYLDHVKELNNTVPKEPFFFLKPTSSYLPSQSPGAKLQIPRGVLAHHEGSFFYTCFRSSSWFTRMHTFLSRTWRRDRSAWTRYSPRGRTKSRCWVQLSLGILPVTLDPLRVFLSCSFSALAVDMTARNVQEVAKSKGLPWAAAKGMDTFTPIG